jgi:hypothetical protein
MKKISLSLVVAAFSMLLGVKSQAATVITPVMVSDINEDVVAKTVSVDSINGENVYQFTLDSPGLVELNVSYEIWSGASGWVHDCISYDAEANDVLETGTTHFGTSGESRFRVYLEAGTYFYTFKWDENELYVSELAYGAAYNISVKEVPINRVGEKPDSISNAESLTLGVPHQCLFTVDSSEQYFKFELTKDSTLSFDCSIDCDPYVTHTDYTDDGWRGNSFGMVTYCYVCIYDSNGKLLSKVDDIDKADDQDFTGTMSLTAGTYYLQYLPDSVGVGSVLVSVDDEASATPSTMPSATPSATSSATPKVSATPSATPKVSATPSAAPSSETISNKVSYGKCKVTWGKSKKAKGYKVYQKGSNGWVLLKTVKKNGCVLSSGVSDKFVRGKSYKFRIKYVNKKGKVIKTLTKSVKAI